MRAATSAASSFASAGATRAGGTLLRVADDGTLLASKSGRAGMVTGTDRGSCERVGNRSAAGVSAAASRTVAPVRLARTLSFELLPPKVIGEVRINSSKSFV
jgi:hypothetical protein